MKIEILFRTQALLNLASAGPAACLFLIVGPGWSCRWRLCRSDRTLNTLTLLCTVRAMRRVKTKILIITYVPLWMGDISSCHDINSVLRYF